MLYEADQTDPKTNRMIADGLYKEGISAGFGDEEVVALIKLLRR